MDCGHKPGASVRTLHKCRLESLGFSDCPRPASQDWGALRGGAAQIGRLGCEPLYWFDPWALEAPGLGYLPWAWAVVRGCIPLHKAGRGAARTGPLT